MIDFLSSPFSLVSVGLGVLAIAIIGMVAWVLSIDRRTRGMVDSLEQERRKVAEMQVFLSRRGNDGARRAPRAPQSGAAVGARVTGEGAAANAHSQAMPAQEASGPTRQSQGRPAQPAAMGGQAGMVQPAAGCVAGAPVAPAAQVAQPAQPAQPAAAAYTHSQVAASASRQEKPRGRGGRGVINVPYGVDQTGGAGYTGLDPRSEAQARAAQAARIRQQAAREAQMRTAQQAAPAPGRGAAAAYTVAARGGVAAGQVPCQASAGQQPAYYSAPAPRTAAAGPSVQTPSGVRYVPSDPNYRRPEEASYAEARPTHSAHFAETVRTSDAHGQEGGYPSQLPYEQRMADRPKSPVDGKRSMPWTAPSEPRGRHAR